MLLPLFVLAIPILDTTLVTIRRLAERRPVTQGGKDHTSHRLVYYGLSETRAVALLALIDVALGATGVAYNVLGRPAVTALGVLVTFALLVQFGGFLDDNPRLRRRRIQGVPGLGTAVEAAAVLVATGADELVIAIRDVSDEPLAAARDGDELLPKRRRAEECRERDPGDRQRGGRDGRFHGRPL